MNYLNIIRSSGFFITEEHNIAFTRVNLSKHDAEKYGFTPICIAYLKNTITRFEYFELINPKMPFSVTKFLIETWDKIEEIGGIPADVSVHSKVYNKLLEQGVSDKIMPDHCGITFVRQEADYYTRKNDHIEYFCSRICHIITEDENSLLNLSLSDINRMIYKGILELRSKNYFDNYEFYSLYQPVPPPKLNNSKTSMTKLRAMLNSGELQLLMVTPEKDISCTWGTTNIPNGIHICRPVAECSIYYAPDVYEGRENDAIDDDYNSRQYRWIAHFMESLDKSDKLKFSEIISPEIISSFLAGHSYLPRNLIKSYINTVRRSGAIFFISTFVSLSEILEAMELTDNDFLFSSSIFDGHAHSHASYVYLRGNIFYILFIDSEKIATRAFYELSPENKVAHNVEMIFNDKLISLVKAYKASPAIDTRNKIFEEVYEVYGDIHAAADRIVASGERNHFLYKDKTALVLQYLLDELNITQISLARNAGVTGSLIFRLLNPKSSNGIKIPTDDHLASIAKYFRITIDQLRGMEDFTFVKHASVERELDARRRKYTTYADSMIKGVSGTGKFSPIFDIMRIITDEKTTVSTLKQIYGISKYLYEKQNEEDNDS